MKTSSVVHSYTSAATAVDFECLCYGGGLFYRNVSKLPNTTHSSVSVHRKTINTTRRTRQDKHIPDQEFDLMTKLKTCT